MRGNGTRTSANSFGPGPGTRETLVTCVPSSSLQVPPRAAASDVHASLPAVIVRCVLHSPVQGKGLLRPPWGLWGAQEESTLPVKS